MVLCAGACGCSSEGWLLLLHGCSLLLLSSGPFAAQPYAALCRWFAADAQEWIGRPTVYTSVKHAEGRLWGWENEASCRFV